MIELDVAEYCHTCDAFEPVANVKNLYSENCRVTTVTNVTCKNSERCRSIAKYLVTQVK
ncbi:hypothetical protein [[Clostridium] innocuum]|nr:hypothetical protein [[Clostridium] innocuum]QSI27793.1 hypothetical protein GKZ87_20950 [Erysipelotrichaceae bacterium 66202529]DAU14229.1 MAG TPA: hypothetical protein [Caudoviricetes sp.]MCC2832097.1 hypothetical protein [[Clostridium] innocuum]MCR0247023.1 hypothetical protein [[Clostridium] innocuum]MCR0258385.1 hypothetical protein [[Clostridium] innocuum]